MRGGAVTIGAQGIKFLLQIASTVVLARLLTPQDFGLVAIATIVTGFIAMFKDAGLSMATVQQAHITHEQVSTLFWINVALSVLLMLVIAAFAPAISWLYGDSRLTGITLTLAATFIFGGLAVQHQALLRRQMRFRALATVDIVAMASGILAAVGVAVMTRSYWALVAMPATTAAVAAMGATIASGWRPSFPRRGADIKPMIKYGGNLTVASFMSYATQGIDKVMLGFAFGASTLGLYRAAYELVMLPVRMQHGPVASVMLPALSRLQSKPAEYRRAYLKVVTFLALTGGPIVAFVFVEADFIIRLLLGSQWSDAVIILQCFVPAAFFATLYSAPRYIFMTTGRTDRQARAAVAELLLMAIAVLVGLQGGVVHVAIAVSVATAISFTLTTYYATRNSHVSMNDIVSHLGPHALAVAASILVGCWVSTLRIEPELARFTACFISGATVYVLVLAAFPKGLWAMRAMVTDVRRFIDRERAG